MVQSPTFLHRQLTLETWGHGCVRLAVGMNFKARSRRILNLSRNAKLAGIPRISVLVITLELFLVLIDARVIDW